MITKIILFVFFTLIYFIIFLVFCAKLGYPIYADIFQEGILYEGEERGKHYMEYLSSIIFPISLLLSIGSVVLIQYFSKIYK